MPISTRPATIAVPPTYNFDEGMLAAFHAEARERGLLYVARDDHPAATMARNPRFEVPGNALLVEVSPRAMAAISEVPGGIVLIWRHQNSGHFYAAGTDVTAAEHALELARLAVPERAIVEKADEIDVRFWTHGSNGPRSVTRSISAPTYDEIRGNYASEARRALDHMVGPDFKPGAGGQLLLWYGPPGTGKTFALRALAQAWRKWCSIDYVVDPEQFFGDATYLMPVLLEVNGPRPRAIDDDGDEDEERWRLLIFEDTGELLSADARTRAGQGLSRLLNVVDGFIGQGLKTLILITTNEELDRLHPAVSRPGRCALKGHFGPLDQATAREWGKRNGVLVPAGQHSLAELFALRDGYTNDESTLSRPIGFGARPLDIRIRSTDPSSTRTEEAS